MNRPQFAHWPMMYIKMVSGGWNQEWLTLRKWEYLKSVSTTKLGLQGTKLIKLPILLMEYSLETSNLYKNILLKFLFTETVVLISLQKKSQIGGFKHQWFWNTIVFSFQFSYYSYTYCSYSFSARSVPSCRDTKAGGIVRNPPTTQDIDTHLSATRWHYNIDICISVHISRTIRDKNKIKSCISYISFLSILWTELTYLLKGKPKLNKTWHT